MRRIFKIAKTRRQLLVLFGLKYGLVTSMLTALAEDPQNRELKPLGSGHYTRYGFGACVPAPRWRS